MEATKKKILFIINPKSGINKHFNIEEIINKNIDHVKFDLDFAYTEGVGHATELAKLASINNIDIVVAIGGDGTVRETAKGLINSKTQLAIIPRGSGNGFAFHFNIPANTIKALEIINNQKSVLIDTGIINNEYFGNIAGVGFDAKIAYEFSRYKKRGLRSYIKIIIREFFKYKSLSYDFVLDDKSFTKKAFLVSIANGSQYGNNAFINPNASVNDGLLEICILRRLPLFHILPMILKLLNKRIHKSKFMEIYTTRNAVISTKEPCFGHIDGDAFDAGNRLEISIRPSSLNLIIP